MIKIYDKIENDIVEELEEENKQKEENLKLDKYLEENYYRLIRSKTDEEMYLKLVRLDGGHHYQVCVSFQRYSPFNLDQRCKMFNDVNNALYDAKMYFNAISYKYHDIKMVEYKKMKWDDHGIFWKIGRTFKDMLWVFS